MEITFGRPETHVWYARDKCLVPETYVGSARDPLLLKRIRIDIVLEKKERWTRRRRVQKQ